MEYKIAAHTDRGIRNCKNQDGVLLKVAHTEYGKLVFGAVCDGMGGLEMGELASATMIRMLSEWFDIKLPEILYRGIHPENLKESWNCLIAGTNNRLHAYGKKKGFQMGTTMVGILLTGKTYYICNVGDSRVYRIREQVELLTKDQTFIQREIDCGRMTYEQAEADVRKNILLQCIGASEVVKPDYYTGTLEQGTTFLLCSDGFRHMVQKEEMLHHLAPYKLKKESAMKRKLLYLTELNKSRMETDNISSALILVE